MSARCLRPEIFRFLDLPRHGLQVIPYDINSAPNPEGEGIIYYSDHDRTANCCAAIRSAMPRRIDEYAHGDQPLLPLHQAHAADDAAGSDPDQSVRAEPHQSLGPSRGPGGPAEDRPRVRAAGRAEHVRHDPLLVDVGGRFPRPVFRDAALEGPRRCVLDHRHRARSLFAGHRLCAAASLHGRGRRPDRRLGLRARRHGLGQQGHRSAAEEAGVEIRVNAEVEKVIVKDGKAIGVALKSRRGNLRQGDRQQRRSQAHLPQAGGQGRSRRDRSRHPPLCQELQDPRLVRETEHRARRLAGVRGSARRNPARAPSISAAISTTSSAHSTTSNTAPGPSGRSSIA